MSSARSLFNRWISEVCPSTEGSDNRRLTSSTRWAAASNLTSTGDSFTAVMGFSTDAPCAQCYAGLALFSDFFLVTYFFLTRSTRPSVSTIFCVPVKNGWQLEQISSLMSPTVDRVLILYPQAQLIVASRYSGCIPAFIE